MISFVPPPFDGPHCVGCSHPAVAEWHEETDTFRRGGRWCTRCGYGVHPPDEVQNR